MVKQEDYQCPRCGYHSYQKARMRNHLYAKKVMCPATKNVIELTDDLKQHILDNRIYHITDNKTTVTQVPPTINTTIHNYHVMNALISGMDPLEKLTKYVDYKIVQITDIEDHLEEAFILKSKRLENNKVKHFSMSIPDMLEVVDSVTSMCQVENFNIIYDEKLNKLKLFSCGNWKSQLIDSGIKELIEKIQSCYLGSYECYLIRKTISSPPFEKRQAEEHLEMFYKFIACFDITPYVTDKTNNQIIYNIDDDRYHEQTSTNDIDEYSLQDTWFAKYKKIKDSINTQEHNKVTKSVRDIIKRNSRNNIIDLNKKMMELFQMDESFKKSIITEITLSISGV